MSVLDAIGWTPLVQLRKVVPPGSARVVVKLEGANPTGNMKDRMAKAAIEAAERDGRLQRGGTVVEYTGGSTGASLALVCAAKGYRCRIVTSDAFSEEKTRDRHRFHTAALEARRGQRSSVGDDGGSGEDVPPPGAGGRDLCRDIFRIECDRCTSRCRAAWARCNRGHDHD